MNYCLVWGLIKSQRTARLTTSHCAPSRWWLIKYMTNRHHVHHLISTRLHCAPPKCTLVQNYIVNLDLYVHFLSMCLVHHVRGVTYWPKCLLSVLVNHQKRRKSSMWTTKKWKLFGVTATSKKISSPCACGAQRRSMVHNVVLYRCSGAQQNPQICQIGAGRGRSKNYNENRKSTKTALVH